MSKIERLRIITSIVGVVILVAMIAAFTRTKQPQYTTDTVVVARGDTLWSIADKYCPKRMDKRQYIENIQTDSGCNVNIYPGDVLVVRVYE